MIGEYEEHPGVEQPRDGQSMAKTNFVPIIVSTILIICANHSVYAKFNTHINEEFNEHIGNNRIILRKMDVDRQFGSSLLGGPLAIAAFLFSLPAIPALLMAPLAVAGLRPTIGAVGQFMAAVNSGNIAQGLANLLNPPKNVDLTESESNVVTSTATGSGSGGSATNSFTSALRSISELIFNRRLSHQFFTKFQSPPKADNKPTEESSDTKPSESSESPQMRIGSLMLSLREVYGILRNGLRRYEITDSDCQSRIICELHQKAVGRSVPLGSFTAQLMDIIGVESHLDRTNAFSEKAKSFIKDFVKAAKTGLTHNDCSTVFSRCPSTSTPDLPHFNALNIDFMKQKPNIYELNQLLQTKLSPMKPNRLAIKPTYLTTPKTVSYYSYVNKL